MGRVWGPTGILISDQPDYLFTANCREEVVSQIVEVGLLTLETSDSWGPSSRKAAEQHKRRCKK